MSIIIKMTGTQFTKPNVANDSENACSLEWYKVIRYRSHLESNWQHSVLNSVTAMYFNIWFQIGWVCIFGFVIRSECSVENNVDCIIFNVLISFAPVLPRDTFQKLAEFDFKFDIISLTSTKFVAIASFKFFFPIFELSISAISLLREYAPLRVKTTLFEIVIRNGQNNLLNSECISQIRTNESHMQTMYVERCARACIHVFFFRGGWAHILKQSTGVRERATALLFNIYNNAERKNRNRI